MLVFDADLVRSMVGSIDRAKISHARGPLVIMLPEVRRESLQVILNHSTKLRNVGLPESLSN